MNYIYDIETYPNFFCAVFKNNDNYLVFEMSSRKDESKELFDFLKSKEIDFLVGFNNIRFDMQVLQFFIEEMPAYRDISGKEKAYLCYTNAQEVIELTTEKDGERQYPPYSETTFSIPQVDIFKIMHLDNKARLCSLKWLEFTLRWHKVQDLPYKFNANLEEHQFDEIIEYCKNDVDFTRYLTKTRKNDILFRMSLCKKFGYERLMNYNDVKIGEYINRITYCERTGKEFKEFRRLKTFQNKFEVEELLHPIIEFKTPELKRFLNTIRDKSFLDQDDDKQFKYMVDIGDLTLSFMKGGIHSEDSPRLIERKDGWQLMEKDVGGMYPATLINNHYYPRHLGEEWVLGLKQNYEYRNDVLKPKMKTLKKYTPKWEKLNVEQGAYKLSLNGGGYGKLGSFYSWQFDPLQKYKTTFFGQLTLMMLMEELHLIGVTLLSANTDGVVIEYPDSLHEKVNQVCKTWEEKTKYVLEDTFYKKIVQSNVNNYIAVITDSDYKEVYTLKYKGRNFILNIEDEPWKNNSQRIISIALKEYFINGVDYKHVIKNLGYEFINGKGEKEKTTIYDYCLGIKINRNQKAFIKKSNSEEREYIDDKILRYYILNDWEERPMLYREYIAGKATGDIISVQKGFPVQPFMEYENKEDYNILYDYYILEVEKIIKPIEKAKLVSTQISLF